MLLHRGLEMRIESQIHALGYMGHKGSHVMRNYAGNLRMLNVHVHTHNQYSLIQNGLILYLLRKLIR